MLDPKGWLGCIDNKEGYILGSQQGLIDPLLFIVLSCKQQILHLDYFLKKELGHWKIS